MLIGHDLDLLVFSALSFAVFDMWIQDTTTSVVMTYLISEVGPTLCSLCSLYLSLLSLSLSISLLSLTL